VSCVTAGSSHGEAKSKDQVFSERVEPFLESLRRFCRSLARNPWDSEDLLQDTLLKAYTASCVHAGSVTQSYLFKIAQNSWIDKLRKQRAPTVELEECAATSAPAVDPLEVRDALTLIVRRLPAKQRYVFLLREVFQLSAAEIAERTGMTEGAVKAALHRARLALQRAAESGGEPGSTAGSVDPSEENTVASYLAAVRQENPQLFITLLARLQMETCGTVEQLRTVAPTAVAPSASRITCSWTTALAA
jgi:RNA polymerase sigma factor (sigma-70 family)